MNFTLELYMECNSTEALGPYKRYGLWLQGCDKNCRGCISPTSRQIGTGYIKTVVEIVQAIKTPPDIEGITVSGGEPFLQVEALESLLVEIKKEKDLGVVIYTGYYMSQLKDLDAYPKIANILSMTDILVDGPFIEELNDNKSLRGSSNQNIFFLTDRYKEFEGKYYGLPGRKTEWNISDGSMRLVGIPDKKTFEIFSQTLDVDKPKIKPK